MTKQEKLAIVIPVYNEAERLQKTLTEWKELGDQLHNQLNQFILILVNDGSKDKSEEILNEWFNKHPQIIKVIHQKNQGHGAAVIHGHRYALKNIGAESTSWIFQVDSDGQFIPDDFTKLWELRSKANFIAGQRKVRHDPLHRLMISACLRFILRLFFHVKCLDPNIPYRLMRGDFLNKALNELPPDLFAPNILLTIMGLTTNQGIQGVQVTHLPRKTGEVSIIRWKLMRACLKSFWQLFKFRIKMNEWKIKLLTKSTI